MIFKNIDDKSKQIQTLNNLLSRSKSEAQKRLIGADLKRVESGYEAEKENAYYLDFEFEKSKNIILLHDLRLEHDGKTAQFDHILISRFGIELLETKSSKGTITINEDGSLNLKNGKYINTYPNPLEQSKRHASVLKDFIIANELVSKRIYMFGGIDISSKVLINPKTTLTNSELPEGFERADSFVSNRRKDIDDTGFFKAVAIISTGYNIDKAKEIAQMLVNAHKPIEFDYTKKFKIAKDTPIKEDISNAIESSPDIEIKHSEDICPRCKEGKLLLRKTKSKKAKEKYENGEFIGCSRYPKCRYTKNIGEQI